MDPLTVGIGSGAATLGGGIWSNLTNLGESKRAREWAANMAGSAWTRTVHDMKNAGLNPALAYSQGPTSTPGAATARVDDVMGPAVSSALQARMQGGQLELVKAQTEGARAVASKASAESESAWYDTFEKGQRYAFYFDEHGRPKGALRELLQSQHAASMATNAKSLSDSAISQYSVAEQKAISDLFGQAGGAGKLLQILLPMMAQFRGRR